MHFEFEQSIGAPRSTVEHAYASAEFYEALGDSPNLAVREVLDRTEEGDAVVLRVRFAFTGSVSSAVRSVVDPARLTWVTVVTVRPDEHRAGFEMLPDHYPDRLQCSGTQHFAESGVATRQVMTGDLAVRVPLVGRTAERAIISGLGEHLQDEAALLGRWAP